MKAKVKNQEIEVQPMNKFDYNNQLLKKEIQHTENKWINGFYCNWNGRQFWLDEDWFNDLYVIENDN